MSLTGRISVILLAVVPAAWGLCPCWLAEAAASKAAAKRIASDVPACCPNCRRQAMSHEAPKPGTPQAPNKAPPPCQGCALMDAGFGTLPAQAVPALPPAALTLSVAFSPPAVAFALRAEDVPVVATGPPFVGLESTVLQI